MSDRHSSTSGAHTETCIEALRAPRTPEDLFAGAGAVRSLARSLDWAATPLGPVCEWSSTLCDAVRTALDSPFPITLWCGPERVLIYNDAYRRVLGAKHPNALGRRGEEVWAEIWPEIGPMFEQIRDGGPPVYAEDAPFWVRREDERETGATGAEPNAWFTFSLSAVRDGAGELVAYLNVVSETTGRILAERATVCALRRAEHAEARLRAIFAQAPSFLAVLRGREHVFEYVNEAYYQLVGHRELLGRPAFEAIPEVRGQGFEELLNSVLETGVPFVGRELPILLAREPGAEPQSRFLDFVYYPLSEAEGERSGLVAHGYDVTEHVLARREAQDARIEAERANQAKSQFLAMMSHEIRTPINAVTGYADLLDGGVAGPLNERQMRYLQRIRASSDHLLGLINDVLDLAKLEADEMRVHRNEVAVRAVTRPALQMIAPQTEAHRLVLREEAACEEAARFIGDEDRARQVLLNLLSNALKFTVPGGAITLRCRYVEAESRGAGQPVGGPWMVLDVEDTGVGIEPEQQARIFEPFVQAEGGHTRPANGTGLGLTISRRFARIMGGDITVQSTPGVGSCFSFWLPAAPSGSTC